MRITHIALLLTSCLAMASAQTYPGYSSLNPDCPAPLSEYTWDDGLSSCVHEGWLVWSAAGGAWGSTITGSSANNAGMRVVFRFDHSSTAGTRLDVINDFETNVTDNSAYPFEIGPNTPYRLDILGLTGNGPNYPTLYTGAIRVEQNCPDQHSCMNRRPQLGYLATNGTTPFFNLTTAAVWDEELGSAFSAPATVSQGGVLLDQNASFAVVNGDTITVTPNICVYDQWGEQIACKATGPLAPGQNFGADIRSWFGQSLFPGGSASGNVLRNIVVSVPPPQKIGVVVYQFTGLAATSLNVNAE